MLALELLAAEDQYELYGFREEHTRYPTEDVAISFLALFPETPAGIFIKLSPLATALSVCGACATRTGRSMRVANSYITSPREQSAGYSYAYDGEYLTCDRHGTRMANPHGGYQTNYFRRHWNEYDARWRLHSETAPALAFCLDGMGWEPLTAHLTAAYLSDAVNALKKRIDTDRVRTQFRMPGAPVYGL